MYLVGLANSRMSTNYAQKSLGSLPKIPSSTRCDTVKVLLLLLYNHLNRRLCLNREHDSNMDSWI